MIDYTLALSTLYPDAEWTLNGDSYEGLTWLSDSPKPTQESIEAQWDSVVRLIALSNLRSKRDELLRGSDWTQLPDAPCDREAWAAYRQELRDLPQTVDPLSPVWPVEP